MEQDATFECEGPPVITDWMQFHYDIANTGNSPSNAPDDNTTKWISDNIGAVASSQAMIVGDKVFVYCGDSLKALSKASGAVLWNSQPMTPSPYGGYSSPAWHDGKVFIGSNDTVYCMNDTTGAEIWNTTLSGAQILNSAPTVANGLVFIGDYNNFAYYALNETTGVVHHVYLSLIHI